MYRTMWIIDNAYKHVANNVNAWCLIMYKLHDNVCDDVCRNCSNCLPCFTPRNGTPPPIRSAASWNRSLCNFAGATRRVFFTGEDGSVTRFSPRSAHRNDDVSKPLAVLQMVDCRVLTWRRSHSIFHGLKPHFSKLWQDLMAIGIPSGIFFCNLTMENHHLKY